MGKADSKFNLQKKCKYAFTSNLYYFFYILTGLSPSSENLNQKSDVNALL